MCVIEEKNISIIIGLICLENPTVLFLSCYFMMLFGEPDKQGTYGSLLLQT
jgi:hypothetical protein